MNLSSNITPVTERIAWVDALKIVACLLVVIAHCTDPFVGAFDSDRTAFVTGVAVGTLTRPSVPLFVMMTAILLLPSPEGLTLGQFYRRRIGRILPALIFWSLVLPVAFYLYFGHANPGSANPTVDTASYTWSGLWHKICLMTVNFNFDTVPLWYLYMLVGLYFIIPVISPWLHRASRRDVRLLLTIWGFTLLLPYIKLLAPAVGYTGNFGSMEIFGACDWNAYGTFYYVSGFFGYMLLAYYIRRWPLQWSRAKTAAICVPMFIAGYCITFFGYLKLQELYPGDYSYLEIIYYFTGINVFMMTFPVLVAFSRLRLRPRPWLGRLASLTFGVYLCHFFFVFVAYDLFDIAGMAPVGRLLLMAVTAFAASCLLTWLMRQWSPTRRLVA